MNIRLSPPTDGELTRQAREGLNSFRLDAGLDIDIEGVLSRLSALLGELELEGEREDIVPWRRLTFARKLLRETVLDALGPARAMRMIAVNSRLDPLLEKSAWELHAKATPPPVPFAELVGLREMWLDMARRVAVALRKENREGEADRLLDFTRQFCEGVRLDAPWSIENARYWLELDALDCDFFSPVRDRQIANTPAALDTGYIEGLAARLERGEVLVEDLTTLFNKIIGGNAEDLLVSDSHRDRVKTDRRSFRWAHDGRDGAFAELLKPRGAVALHLDNLGGELAHSLLLGALLLNAGAARVLLLAKPRVFNLSDVCPEDIHRTVALLCESGDPAISNAGRLLAERLGEGSLAVAEGGRLDFEASGLALSAMQPHVDEFLMEQGVNLEVYFGEGFRGVVQGLGRWPLTAPASLMGITPDGSRFRYPRQVVVAGKIKDCTILRGIAPRLLSEMYEAGEWPWSEGRLLGADFVELFDWERL